MKNNRQTCVIIFFLSLSLPLPFYRSPLFLTHTHIRSIACSFIRSLLRPVLPASPFPFSLPKRNELLNVSLFFFFCCSLKTNAGERVKLSWAERHRPTAATILSLSLADVYCLRKSVTFHNIKTDLPKLNDVECWMVKREKRYILRYFFPIQCPQNIGKNCNIRTPSYYDQNRAKKKKNAR